MDYKPWIGKPDLESKILNSPEPTIVVFAAKWCGYCIRFIELIKSYNPSSVIDSQVVIIDTDSFDGSLWKNYQIDVVPTIIVFQRGKEMYRRNGRPMRGLSQEDLDAALSASGNAK